MKNISQSIRQWRRGNAAAKILNRMDDRMLADIGIARSDINKSVHIFHCRLSGAPAPRNDPTAVPRGRRFGYRLYPPPP